MSNFFIGVRQFLQDLRKLNNGNLLSLRLILASGTKILNPFYAFFIPLGIIVCVGCYMLPNLFYTYVWGCGIYVGLTTGFVSGYILYLVMAYTICDYVIIWETEESVNIASPKKSATIIAADDKKIVVAFYYHQSLPKPYNLAEIEEDRTEFDLETPNDPTKPEGKESKSESKPKQIGVV